MQNINLRTLFFKTIPLICDASLTTAYLSGQVTTYQDSKLK